MSVFAEKLASYCPGIDTWLFRRNHMVLESGPFSGIPTIILETGSTSNSSVVTSGGHTANGYLNVHYLSKVNRKVPADHLDSSTTALLGRVTEWPQIHASHLSINIPGLTKLSQSKYNKKQQIITSDYRNVQLDTLKLWSADIISI